MKVTKSHSFMGYTYIWAENPVLMRASAIRINGEVYPRVVAYDIGNWFVIRGTYDFVGRDIEIL